MTAGGALANVRCVVAGGAGAVGRMFVEILLDAGARVCVVDARPPDSASWRCAFECADITAIGPRLERELRQADIVVLAVPEPVALAAVEGVALALAPGALLADTLSVKSAIIASLHAHAGHLEALSLNPMFAPALGIDGRVVAAVSVHDGPRGQELLGVLRDRGARIVALGAEQHDEMTAVTQALTHAAILACGLALAELDVDVAEIGPAAPPPHVTLLAMVARILGGQPDTYWDVQAANPYAGRARSALAGALDRLSAAVDGGDEADFTAILARIGESFGDEGDHYRDLCEAIFERARPPARPPLQRRERPMT